MTENHLLSHFSPFQINTLLLFFTKWLPAAILDDKKSLSISFLAISDKYATFICICFSQNGCRRPFWIIENHFRSHFSPFQINTLLLFFTKWLPAAILDDQKSLSLSFLAISDQYATFIFLFVFTKWLPFWMTENHFRSHFSPFQNDTQLFFFRMAASGHFGSPICAENNRALPLCVINGYANDEVDR